MNVALSLINMGTTITSFRIINSKTAISKRNGYYRREYVKEYNTVINRTTLNLFIQQVFISNYCMLSTSPNIGDTAVNKMDKIPCSHEVCILMREMNSK